MGFFDPTLIANCLFTGGTRLPELVQGPNWATHGGLILNDFATPPGYQRAWVIKTFFTGPLSVENSTWGGIEAQYTDE